MLKIRLNRIGRKRVNVFRIVVADARRKRSNKGIEDLGYYQPQFKNSYLKINLDRVSYWLKNGAQPTERVEKLMKIAQNNSQYVEEKKTSDQKTAQVSDKAGV